MCQLPDNAAHRCPGLKESGSGTKLPAGWRSVLQALTVAAADPSPSVVDGALDAIQAVTAALFR